MLKKSIHGLFRFYWGVINSTPARIWRRVRAIHDYLCGSTGHTILSGQSTS